MRGKGRENQRVGRGKGLVHLLLRFGCWYSLLQPAFLLAYSETPVAPQSLITQEIRYHMAEAGEVFLVWGINGWTVLPKELQPPDTVVKQGVMYTLMQRTPDFFVTKIRLPVDTILDYGFLITKKRNGVTIRVWEADGDQDYHTAIRPQEIIDIQSTVTLVHEKGRPKDFALGPSLFVGSSLALLLVVLVKRRLPRSHHRVARHPLVHIISTSCSLCLLLLLIRAAILGLGWISFQTLWLQIPYLLVAGYSDFAYAGGITILFVSLVALCRNHPQGQRLLAHLYTSIALVSLLMALVNIQMVQMLGRPFTYQWLYYADFLRSFDAQTALRAQVSWTFLLNLVAVSAGMLLGATILRYGLALLADRYTAPPRPLWMVALLGPVILYCSLASWSLRSPQWEEATVANPVSTFLFSFVQAWKYPPLFTMPVPDTVRAEFPAIDPRTPYRPFLPSPYPDSIRNVIIVVLESVAAAYLEVYGGPYPVTPTLRNARAHSLIFQNIYAHAPASSQSLVSLLGSIYPWISYQSLTAEYPTVTLPTISAELKKYGYRTAFLSSGDFRFQRGDVFLSTRQFDTIQDYRSLPCPRQLFLVASAHWEFPNGIDDACIVEALINWVQQEPAHPFLAILWTYMTHYPYLTVGEEREFGVPDKQLNRYLNALAYSDNLVGKLLQFLQEHTLLDSTLVVVVGDHGEAFGQHGQYGHASKIYEENLHVPLVFIQPKIFTGEDNPVVGGLIDLAPTILHLLNLPIPSLWQGESLLQPQRRGRVYFFAPWSTSLFGFREGTRKLIYDATHQRYEVYDLSKDPTETTNQAPQWPEFVSQGHQRLAAWVQYHEKFLKEWLQIQ